MLPEKFIERFNLVVPHIGEAVDLFKIRKFRSFRVNSLKAKREDIFAQLENLSITFQKVSWYADAFVVSSADARQLLDSSLSAQGLIYAQGLESMLAPLVLDPKQGSNVLDLCAAPGSKTTQIAALMNNQGSIMANEPVRNRSFRLKAVVNLLGAKVQLISKDGRLVNGEGLFDGVLVDAPCSSEGRFCIDSPKSYAFWSERKIMEMAHKQKGLLLNAGRLVKKGGTLVYATCTFGREENEDVVEYFLHKTEGKFKLHEINVPGVLTYPSSIAHCVRVMPDQIMEGFFLAKFTA